MHSVVRAVLASFALAAFAASAQQAAPIERVKITDGEASCRKLFDELGEMDAAIGESKRVQADAAKTTTAGQAGGVAAEAASRSGLFGQIGGLFGHVVGSVASKTAAGVAEQSGKQAGAQAAERERQAVARKEHLSALFLTRGCKASDPDAPAANPGAQLQVAALQPQAAAAPANPEELVRLAAEKPEPLAAGPGFRRHQTEVAAPKRVLVPGFRVAFVMKTQASAYAGAGLANIGQSGPGMRTVTQAQNKRVEMALAGADPALLQALTERLYEDFLAQLRASGRDIVDLAALKATPGYDKLKTVATPYRASPSMHGDPRDYVVFAPRALPLFFMHFDSYLGNAGPFEQESTKAVHELAARLEAVAFIPTLHIDIAEIESSGRSNYSSGAHADLLPKLGVGLGSELRFVNGKDARIFYAGEMGWAIVGKPAFAAGEFGTVRKVEAYDTASLANSLTAVSGLQGAQHFVDKRELRIDPQRYARGVLSLGGAFVKGALAAAAP